MTIQEKLVALNSQIEELRLDLSLDPGDSAQIQRTLRATHKVVNDILGKAPEARPLWRELRLGGSE